MLVEFKIAEVKSLMVNTHNFKDKLYLIKIIYCAAFISVRLFIHYANFTSEVTHCADFASLQLHNTNSECCTEAVCCATFYCTEAIYCTAFNCTKASLKYTELRYCAIFTTLRLLCCVVYLSLHQGYV